MPACSSIGRLSIWKALRPAIRAYYRARSDTWDVSTRMQKEFGCAPFDYLMRLRIERAKLLLLQTDLPVARIGEEVGFNHAAYFTSCFAKYESISPRKYRQRFSHG